MFTSDMTVVKTAAIIIFIRSALITAFSKHAVIAEYPRYVDRNDEIGFSILINSIAEADNSTLVISETIMYLVGWAEGTLYKQIPTPQGVQYKVSGFLEQ